MSQQTITIRIDTNLKEAFELVCRQQDVTVSQAMRQAMRDRIGHHLASMASQLTDEERAALVRMRNATDRADDAGSRT